MRIFSILIFAILSVSKTTNASPLVPAGIYCVEGRIQRKKTEWSILVNQGSLSEVSFVFDKSSPFKENSNKQDAKMKVKVEVACAGTCKATLLDGPHFIEPQQYPAVFNPKEKCN